MKNHLNFFRLFILIFFTTGLIGFKVKAQTINYFFGEFKIKKVLSYYDSISKYVNYTAYANLYSDSVSTSKSYTAVNCGQVFYNNKGLAYNSQIKTYLDTVERKFNTGIRWSVVGANSCNSFTNTLVDSFPSFNFELSLPMQLDKSKNLCVVISGCKYTDEIEVTFFDGQYRISVPYYRKLNYTANLNQIIIPKCDLSTLSGNGVHVTVSLIKIEYKKFNGKKYKFEKRFDFVKPMPLLN